MKRVLAIWLPNWPVQRLVQARPELAGRAVVLHGPSRRGECVTACSRAAADVGVEPGMTIAEALVLVGRVGGHVLEPHDVAANCAALIELVQQCCQFGPTIGLEECSPGVEPETLLLDATNLALLYGSEAALVDLASGMLRRRGLEARIGVAHSVGAAWAAAHFVSSPLPLAALRLPDNMLATFAELGLASVDEVLALDREQLRSRFGPQLLLRINQFLGLTPETIVAVDPPEQFAVEQSFEHPLANGEAVRWALERLLERIVWLLAVRQAGALEIECRLHEECAATVAWSIAIFRPSANVRHLLEMAELTLDRLRLAAPIEAMELEVVRHAPLAQRQGALFDEDRTLQGSRPLAALIDRLAARLGGDAVVQCRPQYDAQPELAWRAEPLVGASLARIDKPRRKAGRKPLAPLDRPLCLLTRPVPLAVSLKTPEGLVKRFRRGREQHVVERWWGPERIETGWWRRQRAARDYFRVETTTGHRFWLFRRRRDDQWFFHGEYA